MRNMKESEEKLPNSNDIRCDFHGKEKRNFYIDENLNVLPCCFYVMSEKKLFERDRRFGEYSEKNPGWNNIKHNKFQDILQSEIYQEYLWFPGWESEDASPICLLKCGKNMKNKRKVRSKKLRKLFK